MQNQGQTLLHCQPKVGKSFPVVKYYHMCAAFSLPFFESLRNSGSLWLEASIVLFLLLRAVDLAWTPPFH